MPEIVYSYQDLETLVKQNYKQPDLELLRRAFELAKQAHHDEYRLTGHPIITHPLAVAYRLAQMKLHLHVVAAGLLHDVVEDADITIEDLRQQFGEDIATLVDSVTKLKKMKYQGVERYVENMRKMFLAVASDVRVIFMKFADRLHNLQTLYAMPKNKQKRIAEESLEIYAPIAGRLGMNEIKGELEDASFAYLDPKEYEHMRSIVEMKVREKGVFVSHVIHETEELLSQNAIMNASVYGRVKRFYSLHIKLQRYEGDLSKIYDLLAVRIVLQNVEECYVILGLLHQKWRPVSGRIKDYIAQPKPNGYQSLHTTVFTENGEVVEFQIRTREMHEIAEYGIAAHWRYKEGGDKPNKQLRWIEELVGIQKEIETKKDFLDQLEILKIDVFKDRIFVFTPKGDVIELPEGGTPVDFAYAIHTDIGNKCASAKINGKVVNLDAPLKSGDIIDIVTDKNRKSPNADWIKFCKTRHARQKIRDATRHTVKGWITHVLQGREKAKKSVKRRL